MENNVTEKVNEVTQKINETEIVQKAKNSKHFKWIKLVVIAIVVILAISLLSALFGDSKAKDAEKFIEKEISGTFEEADIDDIKIKTKAIGKNKDSDLYAFDVVVTGKKPDGEKSEAKQFIIVYSDGDDVYAVGEYVYEDENKSTKKEMTLSALARG